MTTYSFLHLKTISSVLIGGLALTLVGCGSIEHTSSTASALRIERMSEDISSVRAFESGGRLYVAGTFRRGHGRLITAPAHVDVSLIGPGGSVIASIDDDIEPVHPQREKASGRRYSYSVSFPIEKARQAEAIRVGFDTSPHAS